jgi:hypothetical protein
VLDIPVVVKPCHSHNLLYTLHRRRHLKKHAANTNVARSRKKSPCPCHHWCTKCLRIDKQTSKHALVL